MSGAGGSARRAAYALAAALVATAMVLAWIARGPDPATPARDAAGEHVDTADVVAMVSTFERTADYDYDPPPPGSYALPPIKAAPDATLLDHTGQRLRLGGLWGGRISLVSFVYLTCGDQDGCPLAMSVLYDIEHASRQAPLLRRKAQLVTVSFDPKRDPPAALAALAEPKQADVAADRTMPWRFLTGTSEADMAPMLAAFGQRVDRSGDAERINHLLRMYLVDAMGRIRNIYGLGTIDPRLIMTDVATLLMEGADETGR